MALTSTGWEAQALRRHLGYGNITTGAYPSTPDGFLELFEGVILPNLQSALETTAMSSVDGEGVESIEVLVATGIAPYTRLVVDVADDAETVTVRRVVGNTVHAKFSKAHTECYPVAIESGTAVLRLLLHSANKLYEAIQSTSISSSAGLKSLGQGEIEWYEGSEELAETVTQYRSVQRQISDLVRVPVCGGDSGQLSRLEAY